MTEPVVRLETTHVAVVPGGQVRVAVTVRNPGRIVEGYRLTVLHERDGASAPLPWAEVTPPTFPVDTGAEQSAVVVFSPPGGRGATSGPVSFAVKVESTVQQGVATVVEGVVEVGQVFGMQSKIVPVSSAGRWSARHRIELTNWGNEAARLRLTASDPDEQLGFLVSPELVDVPLGGSAHTRVKVRTRHPTLRGQTRRLPFRVVAEPDPPGAPEVGPDGGVVEDQRRQVLEGAFEQKPILTRVVVGAAVLALLLAVAGIVLALRGDEDPDAFSSASSGPPAPAGVAVVAQSAGSVTVRWDPAEVTLAGHEVIPVSPSGDLGTAVQVADPANSVLVEDLQAGREHCFQVVAIDAEEQRSEASEGCGETPTAGADGPDAPAGLEVTQVTGSSLQLGWDPVDGAEAYQVIVAGVPEASSPTEPTYTVSGLEPETTYCVAVAAVQGGQPGEQSEQACADTTAGETATPTSGTGEPPTDDGAGGQLEPDEWVVVAHAHAPDDTGTVQQEVDALEADGRDVLVTVAAAVPDLPFDPDEVLVVVRGFESEADATTACPDLEDSQIVECPGGAGSLPSAVQQVGDPDATAP